jgi:sugar lactone lactonase YvrE
MKNRALSVGPALAVGLVLLLAAAGTAQLAPGKIVVGDSSGNLWLLDTKAAAPTLFVTLPSAVYGIDVDYHGDLICGGSTILWKVTPTGRVSTILQGSPLVSLQGDVEVNQNGNFYVTSMGSSTIWEMTHGGVVITTYAVTTSSRTWGLGIDPRDGTLYVAGYSTIHQINPGTGQVKDIASGSPFTFLQGAHFGPRGTFVAADQNSNGLYEIDPQGKVVTVYAGAPLGDIEGVDHHYSGSYVLSDDGSPGTVRNAVFLVTVSSPAVVTTMAAGGSFGDLNGCAVVPALRVARASANPKPGGKALLAVTSNGAAMDQYVFASSLSAGAGIPLPGGLRFPLDPDGLFFATAQNLLPGLFQNYRGALDVAGSAGLTIAVPNIPGLVGITIHTAGLTLNRNTLTGVHLISNVATVKIE